MVALAACALLALCAVSAAHAQDTRIFLDLNQASDEVEDVEKRYTNELKQELQLAKDDALFLYTEYSGKAGRVLREFLKEMTGFADRSIRSMDDRLHVMASNRCRVELEKGLKKIEHDAKKAASFSGVNHHKFLLGHMIVFRMHLNKSEDYLNKCDNVIRTCGVPCETTPRIQRWRRHASNELHRVRDELEHSRMSYKDIVTHAHRQLKHLRKQADKRAEETRLEYKRCIN